MLTTLPRTSLGFFPTPIHPLPNLSARLGGPALWVKRDDQTGLATGGNKTRKLEFLVADALAAARRHADHRRRAAVESCAADGRRRRQEPA